MWAALSHNLGVRVNTKILVTSLVTGDFDEMDLEFDIIDRNDNTPVFITGSTSITVPPSDYVKQLSKKEWTKCRGLTHIFY